MNDSMWFTRLPSASVPTIYQPPSSSSFPSPSRRVLLLLLLLLLLVAQEQQNDFHTVRKLCLIPARRAQPLLLHSPPSIAFWNRLQMHSPNTTFQIHCHCVPSVSSHQEDHKTQRRQRGPSVGLAQTPEACPQRCTYICAIHAASQLADVPSSDT